MGLLSFLGLSRIQDALRAGAIIVDVRTAFEYDNGRIPGSVNIPVDRIPGNVERIRHFNKPVIICCTDGMRSHKAIEVLKANGIKDVVYGGNWQSVLRKMK